jgi:hypothetical protein
MEDLNEMQAQGIPVEVLKRREASWLYLLAVGALALIGVLSVLGALILAWGGKTVPGEVWTVVGIAVGGLVAMVGQNQGQQGA